MRYVFKTTELGQFQSLLNEMEKHAMRLHSFTVYRGDMVAAVFENVPPSASGIANSAVIAEFDAIVEAAKPARGRPKLSLVSENPLSA